MKFSKFSMWFGSYAWTLLLTVILFQLGFFHFTIANDITWISMLILGAYNAGSLTIGYLIFTKQLTKSKQSRMRFLYDVMVTLGFIGTIIGLMLVFGTAFTTLDLNNVDTTLEVVKSLASGVSVALLTTLYGQVCGLLYLMQLQAVSGTES